MPSPPISRPPPQPPLGTTMSTKDTAVRRAGQQEISSQPTSQGVGKKSTSHTYSARWLVKGKALLSENYCVSTEGRGRGPRRV
ncbi:unnamed protein product, partial [Sphagnum compactum]